MSNPYILTHIGRHFDLLNPSQKDVSIYDIARALSHICRFTGHARTFYSVAQHSVLVSNLVPDEYRFEALMHDAHEAYMGDVATPVKRVLGPALSSLEDRVSLAVRTRFQLPIDTSPVVKKADALALAIEREWLMCHDPTPWPALADVPEELVRKPRAFIPLLPDAAMERFITEFKLLGGMHI